MVIILLTAQEAACCVKDQGALWFLVVRNTPSPQYLSSSDSLRSIPLPPTPLPQKGKPSKHIQFLIIFGYDYTNFVI